MRNDKIAEIRDKLAGTRQQMDQTQSSVGARSAQIDRLSRSTSASPNNNNAGNNTPQIFSEADKKKEIRRKYESIDRLNLQLKNPIGETNQLESFDQRLSKAEFNYAREDANTKRLMAILHEATETKADDFMGAFTEFHKALKASNDLAEESLRPMASASRSHTVEEEESKGCTIS
jgi:hypothetical protein